MGTSPEQNIDIHLACRNQKRVGISRGDDRVAMGEPDAKAAVGHDFGEGEIGRVDVEVTFDQLQIGSDLAEEFKGVAVGEVAQTQDLADLAWR